MHFENFHIIYGIFDQEVEKQEEKVPVFNFIFILVLNKIGQAGS